MKHYFSLFCLAYLLSAHSAAQPNHGELAFDAGAGMINLYQPHVEQESYTPYVGWNVGLKYQYAFNKVIAIRTGVGFSRKGAMLNSPEERPQQLLPPEESMYQKMEYLYVPLLGRIHLGTDGNFFFNLGPYLAYMTNSGYAVQSFETALAGEEAEKALKTVDLGFTGGIGGVIPVNSAIKFTVELQSDFGLYDVKNTPLAADDALYTRTANVMVGMQYRLP